MQEILLILSKIALKSKEDLRISKKSGTFAGKISDYGS